MCSQDIKIILLYPEKPYAMVAYVPSKKKKNGLKMTPNHQSVQSKINFY